MTATPATALTADELSTVQAFDAAPYPVEVAEAAHVETVARAMWESPRVPNESVIPWTAAAGWQQRRYRALAAAAVAAYRATQDGGAEEAVRDDWLYNEAGGVLYGPDPDNPHLRYPFATNVEASVGEFIADTMNRAALAPQAGDGAR